MKKFSQSLISVAVLTCLASAAAAKDELVVHVFRDGAIASDLAASLDGGTPMPASSSGAFVFDLGAGPHSIQVLAAGQPVHAFRFDAAAGQNVDINVTLSQDSPQVEIESYAKNQVAVERSGAPTGSLTGVVTLGGAPLQGATVTARDSRVFVTTDAQGRYTLELPRGSYEVAVSHPQITGGPLKQTLRIVTGINGRQDLAFASDGTVAQNVVPADVEQVVVVSKRETERTEQAATNIVDIIDAEQLARVGGTDVAASVVRVPSITIQQDRYVFIRGLGDRYVTTTLNGATLPRTDPSKRTVPLDLFPTNIVSQLDVRKTFSANMPGESTGGNLVINTRTFPTEPGGSVTMSTSYTSDLTGKRVSADPISGDFDALGADDGSRQENGLLPLISDAIGRSDELSANQITRLQQAGGFLIKDNLDPKRTTAGPKGTLNMNYGDVFQIGEAELGYFAAGNYTNGWSQRTDGITRTYGSGGGTLDDFKFEEQTNFVDSSGLLSLGLSVGAHSFASNTLVSRSTESSVRTSDGFDGDELVPSYRYSMEWIERQFIAQQFSGQHSLGNLLAKWQLTGSRAEREAPDRREVRYDLRTGDDRDPTTGDIVDGVGSGNGIYNLKTADLLRRYDDLTDDNLDLSTDWSYQFDNSTLSVGAQGIKRERESDSRSYGFRGAESNASNLLVSDVINVDTITGNQATGYAFVDKTLPSDSYDADLDLYAGYVSYDMKFADDYQVVAGGRYEQFKQTTDTFSLAGAQDAVTSEIDEGIFLPSLSFNWYIDGERQLRAVASRTVARPDFKETSNATFYDNEFDFRVRGNPLLKISEVDNFDLRFEQYWDDGQNASVALFYKDLKDPIERVAVTASGTAGNTRTYQNADSAKIYGVEIDGRKEFSLDSAFTHTLFLALNASYIESEVDLAGGDSRKLQGQPDYTANLILGYDDTSTRQQITLLLNQNGDSIQDVGIQGNPDIIEEPRLSLNLNYRYEVLDDLVLKFKAVNLLDEDVEFTQGGKVFQGYRRGAEFEAGFDWKF